MKTMTFFAALGVFLSLFTLGRAQEGGAGIQLRGIARFGERQLALLEKSSGQVWGRNLLLARGEREGDTEVLEIDVAAGRVKVRAGSETISLELPADSAGALRAETPGNPLGPKEAPATIRLRGAGPGLVFRLYQLMAKRTLLRPAALPDFRLDLAVTEPATTSQAQAAIEQALAGKGIFLRPDRDKFVLAVGGASFQHPPAELWPLAETIEKGRVRPPGGAAGEEQLPAGAINFPNTDLHQVLMIYQELTDRTVIRPPALPASTITLQTYTPLSRGEAVYAFSLALFLNGISVVPADDKFLLVLPSFQAKDASAMIARKPAVVPPAAARPIPALGINLTRAGFLQVAATYQQISGRAVETDPDLPKLHFTLRTQTPLSAAEGLRALDLLLASQGFAVVASSTGGGLKIVPRVPGQ